LRKNLGVKIREEGKKNGEDILKEKSFAPREKSSSLRKGKKVFLGRNPLSNWEKKSD